jgi:hypothetical protein
MSFQGIFCAYFKGYFAHSTLKPSYLHMRRLAGFLNYLRPIIYGIYNIVFTYKDECFLAAGEYENDQIQLIILDVIDQKDITENMLKTDYICYYSLFYDVESHDVFQHIDEVLSTGIRFVQELVS